MTRIVVAALALLVATAAAADAIPAKFRGEWCIASQLDEGTSAYKRGRCRNSDGWLAVLATGYNAHETRCKLLNSATDAKGRFLARFACNAEGTDWFENRWIELKREQLFFTVSVKSPER